jgi:hypothetical protein
MPSSRKLSTLTGQEAPGPKAVRKPHGSAIRPVASLPSGRASITQPPRAGWRRSAGHVKPEQDYQPCRRPNHVPTGWLAAGGAGNAVLEATA